ncbi:hypothetical protein BT69DRAFT_1338789 [Atractiella rhizophila]|nr:hypothetical protein BT69DRAFT_1338789 [Atractiella rhizophila]
MSAPPPHTSASTSSGKKKALPPPATPEETYKALQSRIAAEGGDVVDLGGLGRLESSNAALEEEVRRDESAARERLGGGGDGDGEVLGKGEVERKYIELFKEMKRNEREWMKEKKRLLKDKELVKSDLTKANAARTKLEKLSRDLTKENKRLASLSASTSTSASNSTSTVAVGGGGASERRLSTLEAEVEQQYEMREKYYECVLRAKDLEVALERARGEKWRRRAEELERERERTKR